MNHLFLFRPACSRLLACLIPLLRLLTFEAAGQTRETFDLASFQPMKGWKKDIRSNVVSYTKSGTTGYCVIAIYKNTEGSDRVETDFEQDWQELVAGRFTVTAAPQSETGTRTDGWKSKAGAAGIHDGNGAAMALLSTFSLSGRKLSVLVLMSQESYLGEVDKFLSSLQLQKPKGNTALPLPAGKTPFKNGISIATSRFDDGWTASIEKDWVKVEKNGTTVYLYYYFNVGPEWRPPNGNIRDHLWNRFVKTRFQVISENENRRTLIDEWKEGEGTETETGRRVYLAMGWNGNFFLAVTPDKASSNALFPTPSALYDMARYNKFAVTQKDLAGHWQSGGSQTTQWYNEVTGLYTGASLAATSATFQLLPGGSYKSIHNGATGAVVGGMNTFQQQYTGKFSVSNWQIIFTNRYQGKTDSFDAHFQAVRGGRLLYLNNKRGEQYLLVRTKN